MSKPLNFQLIPFENLHISPTNMRDSKTQPDVSHILPSIREKGILQPLIVRFEPLEGYQGDYGICAGRSRFTCLTMLALEGVELADVPCIIIDSEDDGAAIEASLIENYARLDATEIEQYRTFSALQKQGKSIDEIAAVFGLETLAVKKRLALGELNPKILDLYDTKEITADTFRALTLANKTQQREWLKLFNSEDEYAPLGSNIKNWIAGGGAIRTDAAIFDLDSYKGKIITDLFGKSDQFASNDKFWTFQNKAIGEAQAAYLADGWQEVEIVSSFSSWCYHKTEKESGGRVYIEVRQNGDVEFYEGYLTEAEGKKLKKAQAKAEAAGLPPAKAAPKDEMSGPLVNYFDLHRHSIARHALISRQDLALRLIVVHMLAGSSLWAVGPDARKSHKEDTQISADNSLAEMELKSERKAVEKLLGFELKRATYSKNWAGVPDSDKLFAKMLTLSDDDVMQVLTLLMADSLDCGGSKVEAIGVLTGIDHAAWWTPDEAFFTLLRDKGVINAMLSEVGGKANATAYITATGKAQKEVIKNIISGEGRDAPNDVWRPRWAAFPAKAYRKIDLCKPARLWSQVKAAYKGQSCKK